MAKKCFLAPCLVIIGISLSHCCVQASDDALLGTDMTRPGFQAALEGAFSPLLIPYAIVQGFTFGKWNPEILEWADRSLFIDSQIRAGYAFHSIPLEVRVGFEVLLFGKPIEELEEGNLVRLDCTALGGSLGLTYYF